MGSVDASQRKHQRRPSASSQLKQLYIPCLPCNHFGPTFLKLCGFTKTSTHAPKVLRIMEMVRSMGWIGVEKTIALMLGHLSYQAILILLSQVLGEVLTITHLDLFGTSTTITTACDTFYY